MTTCRTCQRELAANQFYPSTPTECRDCRSAYPRAWRAANAEKTRRYAREAYRDRRIVRLAEITRICEHCGGAIPFKRTTRSIFCSRQCAHRAGDVRESEARRLARTGRVCAKCGGEISPARSLKSKTCSTKCTAALNESAQMHRRCRKLSHYALRMGRLIPEPCEVCGDWDVEMHHVDYLEPLNVRWFCFEHHRTMMHGQQVVDRS